MFELVVIWSDGNRDVFEYRTRSEAEDAADNMRMACGNQVSWCGVREKVAPRCEVMSREGYLRVMYSKANALMKHYTRQGEDEVWQMSSDWNACHDESDEIAVYELDNGFMIEDAPYYYDQMVGAE